MSRTSETLPGQPDEETPAADPFAELERCRHTTAHGKRCGNLITNSALGLCFYHERRVNERNASHSRAVSEELLGGGNGEFKSRGEVQLVLAKLFLLVSTGRISREQATLLAYIASLVLQTIPHIPAANEDDLANPVRLIFDGPSLQNEETGQDDSERK